MQDQVLINHELHLYFKSLGVAGVEGRRGLGLKGMAELECQKCKVLKKLVSFNTAG